MLYNWADDLKLTDYFNLRAESDHGKSASQPEEIMKSIEEGQLDDENDLQKKREMEKFIRSQASSDINTTVAFLMVEAIRELEKLSKERVVKVAYEIAMEGSQGFDPQKDGYTISALPGKTFSGHKILAWYYVSFAIALPQMLDATQLPYKKEFEVAQRFL